MTKLTAVKKVTAEQKVGGLQGTVKGPAGSAKERLKYVKMNVPAVSVPQKVWPTVRIMARNARKPVDCARA